MNYGYQYNPAAAAAAFYPAAAQAVMQPQQAAPARFVAPNNIQATQFNPNFNKYPQNPINPATGSYSAISNPAPGFNSPPKQNVQAAYKPSYGNFVPAGANKPPPNTNPNPQPPPPQQHQSHYSGNKGPNNYNPSNNNSHNEKFEKAVINAAISVAQQKEGGGGGFGRGGGGGGGRGGYGGGPGGGGGGYNRPPRQWNKKPSGGDNQMHYCEVCKISCGGEQTFKTHIEGKQHKKKEAQMKAGGSLVMSSLKPGMTAFHCELCDITCTSQDAFNSHTAGAKHQKVAKLHEKLGKPVPQLSSAKEAQLKIVAASGVNLQQMQGAGAVGGTAGPGPAGFKAGPGGSSSTVAVPITSALAMSSNDGDDQVTNEIIGAEYVEVIQMGDGKVVQYNCKLCECKFNDASAKDLHLKGRRHRLSYKKKVNPSLVVENPAHRSKQRKQEQERLNRMRAGQAAALGGLSQSDSVWAMKEEMKKMEDELYARFGGGGASSNKKAESFDDRHVLAKHQTIYPDEATLEVVQDIVVKTEKALKIVSDKIYEEDKAKAQEESLTTPIEVPKEEPAAEGDGSAEKQSQSQDQKPATVKNEADVSIDNDDEAAKYRELKGVMRIGTLAKGLMLKGDTRVSLAVLCQHWPTTIVLSRMFKFLPSVLKEISESEEDPFDISLRLNDGVIVIQSKSAPIITLTVYLTSPVCRTEMNENPIEAGIATPASESEEKPKPAANSQEALEEKSKIPKDVCMAVLAELRHQKWFEARASGLASCVIIVRVIYDLINRVSSWNPLPRWAAELLVEKALSCSAQSFMSPGDALRRVIETIASGVLLPEGCGLLDPCERDRSDAAGALTHQQREDITASAQHALRLITFKSIHKVLGIQPLPSVDRKRPAVMMSPGNATPAGTLTGAKVTKL